MALTSSLYLDAESLRFVRAPGKARERSFVHLGSVLDPLTLGDTRALQVTWVRKVDGVWLPVTESGRTVTLSLVPTFPPLPRGELVVSFGGDSTEDLEETESVKPVLVLGEHTLCQLEATLNALPSVMATGSSVTVTPIYPPYLAGSGQAGAAHRQAFPSSFLISWNDAGVRASFTVALRKAWPLPFAGSVSVLRAGSETVFHREAFVTEPAAMASVSFDDVSTSPVATLEEFQAGDETTVAGHRLVIDPEPSPGDMFRLTYTLGVETLSTEWLPMEATAEDLSSALNAILEQTVILPVEDQENFVGESVSLDVTALFREGLASGVCARKLNVGAWEWLYGDVGAQVLPTIETRFRSYTAQTGTFAWEDAVAFESLGGPLKAELEMTVSGGDAVFTSKVPMLISQ